MNNISIPRFFWRHIKPYKWYYFIMILVPIISGFYPFAYNYAIKLFLDAMVDDTPFTYQNLMFPIILFISTQFSIDIIWRISNIAEWKSEPYVRRSIILSSYDYVQHHSYKYFQDNFTGAISSKLKSILDGYDKFWAEISHGLLSGLYIIVINITVLAFVNYHLGLFILAWCAVYVPIMYQFSKRLHTLTFEETESRHKIIGKLSDKLTNIIALFSYAARKPELSRLHKFASEDFIPKQIKVYKYDFMMQVVGGVLYIFMFVFTMFYMLHLRMSGAISVGGFAFVFAMTIDVAQHMWRVTTALQDFARSMGDLKSALTVVNAPQDNLDSPDAKPLNLKNPSIEFRDISFTYSDKKIVFESLNLHIKPGEKIGLVGHSGAGKSSLVNLLLKYFSPKSGSIYVDNQNIQDITQDSLRSHIAVIPQDTMLFHRTLMENIRFGKLEATDEEVHEAAKKAHIHDYIMTLPEQYNTMVGERGIKLSGGQRQRISIARAILKDAPILILDEATSSLDSQTEQFIQDSLNFFIENKNKTVLAIAHRLSTLKHMDRLIVLDKGKIIEEGTHHQLMRNKNSLYKKLWEYQES